ncbi:response regulator [Tepidanaerobacter sp. GT38]|uniref:response regulator transcription factor n=1 Tax=Tepidanaerobacter sp. GT38 TaxID=2722793 RepID=UPI001F00D8B3|nr:response regulator [Tepidanaerobacter sp. GT38]MCG1013026.1 response regulator [Tepidanaerobacter sp. GT38]
MEYTVLICDDEVLERQVLKSIIESSNLPLKVVGEARNGIEALEQSEKLRPDILLIDIKMPGKDGITAGAEIKKLCPKCKAIFITAYDEFEYVKRALQIGAVEYLLKPARPDEILALLAKTVDELNQERQKKLKEEKLLESIKQAAGMLKSSIMVSLIMGHIEDESVLKSRAKLLGIKEFPSSIMIILPDVGADHSEAELERYEVFRFIENKYLNDDNVFLFFMSEEIVMGLTSAYGSAVSVAEEIRKMIEENLDITVTIGVGEDHKDIKGLFNDARLAAQLGRFYIGSNNVITSNMIQDFLGRLGENKLDKENTLLEYVKMGNYKEALVVMEQILQDIFVLSKGSLVDSQVRICEVMVMVWRTARQVGLIEPENSYIYSNYLQKLTRCQTYAALKNCCEDFLEEVFSKINNFDSSDIIKQAMKYIEENYNEDIKLARLAKEIYISPDYFSRLFKKVAGCTYVEYITKIRIENAKILLTNPIISIAEVAKKTGYSDPNYFSKVFKKTVGMSPTQYKKIHNNP